MDGTGQEILERLQKIIEEIIGIEPAQVTPESSFLDDLNVDSLSMVEVAVAAQDEFGVEIPDEKFKDLITVGDAIAFIQR